MASVPGKYLNFENIIKKVFDHTTDSLKTSAIASGPTSIVISSMDDSIAIGNVAGDLMTVNPNGTINTNIFGITPISGKLPVDINGGSINITGPITISNEVEIKNDSGNPVPVSGTVVVTGVATLAEQQTQTTALNSIDSKLTSPITVSANNLDIRDLVFTTDKVDASGSSVSVSNFPSVQPVSATSLPLPTGAATSALQTTGNSSVSSIDAKTPALGQALAAASVPVVLTSTQLSTLTPLSTITANIGTTNGLALDTSVNSLLKPASTLNAVTTVGGITNTVVVKADTIINQTNAFKVDGSAVTQPVSATSLPLPTGAATSTLQTAGNVSLNSLDSKVPSLSTTSGNLNVNIASGNVTISSEVEIKNDSGNPIPVSGTVISNLGTIAGVATESTLASINTKVPTNLTVTATRLLVDNSGVTQPISAATLPLPSGASTTALQSAGNTSLSNIDTKTPALGQALAAASVPVVLTASQLSTLTPFSSVSITGTANVNVTNAS